MYMHMKKMRLVCFWSLFKHGQANEQEYKELMGEVHTYTAPFCPQHWPARSVEMSLLMTP